MRKDRNTSMYRRLYIYTQACVRENGRKREREGEKERRRERQRRRENPCRFLLQLIHLHYWMEPASGRRKERTERKKQEEERERGNERASERSGIQAAKELSAILFYLSRLPLDRIHRFLTLALSPLLCNGRYPRSPPM